MTQKKKDTGPGFISLGNLFHRFVHALKLHQWKDVLDNSPRQKDCGSDKVLVASRADLDALCPWEINEQLLLYLKHDAIDEDVRVAVIECWNILACDHVSTLKREVTFLDGDGTRRWLTLRSAPRWMGVAVVLRLMFKRRGRKGPMLDESVEALVRRYMKSEYRNYASCFNALAEDDNLRLDENTLRAWRKGNSEPRFSLLGQVFKREVDDKRLEWLLNAALGSYIDSVFIELHPLVEKSCWEGLVETLVQVSACYASVQECFDHDRFVYISAADYNSLLFERINEVEYLAKRVATGDVLCAMDVRMPPVRFLSKYYSEYVHVEFPTDLGAFIERLHDLIDTSALCREPVDEEALCDRQECLMTDYPHYKSIFEGIYYALDARLALRKALQVKQTKQFSSRIKNALESYWKGAEGAVLRMGAHSKWVLAEALGLYAFVEVPEVREALLPGRDSGRLANTFASRRKRLLASWEFFQFEPDFYHENEEQRFERVRDFFLSEVLAPDLCDALLRKVPRYIRPQRRVGCVTLIDKEGWKDILSHRLDPRMKDPVGITLTGRKQSPLMEAIERQDLEMAEAFVDKGVDLNFINSTGDTAFTKALAVGYDGLVLRMLDRVKDPVKIEALSRETDNWKTHALIDIVGFGKCPILKRVLESFPELVNRRVCGGRTPLCHAVDVLGKYRQGLLMTELPIDSERHRQNCEPVKNIMMAKIDACGILSCIRFLAKSSGADLDVPHINNHSPLTLAAEYGMNDVVAILLGAGASVNHCAIGGATALCYAIQNDDFEMTQILLEYKADYCRYVEAWGRPIYTYPMSDRLRTLIPYRLGS